LTLPAFDSNGDLPTGIHPATLQELRMRFGEQNRTREIVFGRLERIARIARRTGHLARMIVYGSFVTAKHEPNDVDVFLIFAETFDSSMCDAETSLLLDHATADAHFGASVFWLRRPAAFGGEQATIEFWQTRRDGRLRGIVEIVENDDDPK
jgi:hypothetical protein